MPSINIQGTIIDFPDSAAAPNWAEAIDQFANAVAGALGSVVGAFDVAAQALIIDPYNPGTNVDIAALSFPVSTVRSAFIRYAVFRQTSTNSVYESGELLVVFNPFGPTGNKWEISQRLVGDGQIRFSITDAGQVQFTTIAIAGSSHTGKLTFVAQSILQS